MSEVPEEIDDQREEDGSECTCGAYHDEEELDGVCKCCGLRVDFNDG